MDRRLACCVALSFAFGFGFVGCRPPGDGDRLEAGTEAMAYNDRNDVAGVSGLPRGTGILHNGTFGVVPVGTRVRVLGDGAADDPTGERYVDVAILEGKYAGNRGKIFRNQLQPVAK